MRMSAFIGVVNETKVHNVIKNGQCTSNMHAHPIVIVLTCKMYYE